MLGSAWVWCLALLMSGNSECLRLGCCQIKVSYSNFWRNGNDTIWKCIWLELSYLCSAVKFAIYFPFSFVFLLYNLEISWRFQPFNPVRICYITATQPRIKKRNKTHNWYWWWRKHLCHSRYSEYNSKTQRVTSSPI